MNRNSYGNGFNNRNGYNNNHNYNNYGKVNKWNNHGIYNKNTNNNKESKEKQPHPSSIFLIFLLVITFGVMFFHVVSVIRYNNSINNKKEEEKAPTNIIDSQNEAATKEEKNKEELVKLCKVIDDKGSYKYEEYVKYINSFGNNLTDAEKYKAMSKMNYCYQWMCIKIEEEGIINYVECDTEKYVRVSFEEYQDLKNEQTRTEEALNKACDNLSEHGSYDSGAATGLRVTCNNYICSLDYDGEILTKNCKK